MFSRDGCHYVVIGDGLVRIRKMECNFDHLVIPPTVCNEDGKIYKIIKIEKYTLPCSGKATIISFDEASDITEVPTNFINSCKLIFLPPKIRRVVSEENFGAFGKQAAPVIVPYKNNPFVSLYGSKSIMNNHPLELIYQHSCRIRLFIRETVHIIGINAYRGNEGLTSVVFPSSVEIIDENAFAGCTNLASIVFKGKSKLRRIGKNSFINTKLKKIDFPSSLEVIEEKAFNECFELSSISFPKDSMLNCIENYTFSRSSIESIEIPPNIEIIGQYAFSGCHKLESISFSNNSNLKIIGVNAFTGANIESIIFPQKLVFIRERAFCGCKKLNKITFPIDSALKTIGSGAFSWCRNLNLIETYNFINLVNINGTAFEECPSKLILSK